MAVAVVALRRGSVAGQEAGQEADFEDSVFLEISSPHHRLGDIEGATHGAGLPRSLVSIFSRLGSPLVHFFAQRLCR